MNDFDLISPRKTEELRKAISGKKKRPVRLIAGGTDVLMELKKECPENLLLINLKQMDDHDMCHISFHEDHTEIGALCTISSLLSEDAIGKRYPVLKEAASSLASVQIRNVATVGGNICTASPSGDVACAMMALDASCKIANVQGEFRSIALSSFFTGLRKTVLRPDEWLHSVSIPFHPEEQLYSGFVKIGTRRSMECSVVSLAWHIESNNRGITAAGIACGSVAPIIITASDASAFLIGKILPLGESDRTVFVRKALSKACPIDDIRASAWYRSKVLENLLQGLSKKEIMA